MDQQDEKLFERINGQDIRVGSVDEFVKEVFGVTLKKTNPGNSAEAKPEGYPPLPKGLILGIEKFKTYSHRWYRLIWVGQEKAWLAAEDMNDYRRHREVVEAGRKVAEATGAYFDVVTR